MQHRWPVWLWVRKQLGLGPAGLDVIRSLPYLGQDSGQRGLFYGLVWLSGAPEATPNSALAYLPDDATVGLTIAGLARNGDVRVVTDFLGVLGLAVRKSSDFRPAPGETSQPPFTRTDVEAAGVAGVVLGTAITYELLTHEPPFWVGRSGNEDTWSFNITDHIERYSSATTAETYLASVDSYIAEAAAGRQYGVVVAPDRRRMAWLRSRPKVIGASVLALVGTSTAAVARDYVIDGIRAALSWVARLF